MCGLFGFLNYGDKGDLQILTNSLAKESAVRGTDAVGIAFNDGNRLNIQKEAKSAYRHDFRHSGGVRALIGHTRHSTQGSEKKNCNNHPFSGKTKNARFALAHNGVLTNDGELRKKFRIAKTKIETDSYIAVQLIEHERRLDFESLKFMAEQVRGTFSFTVLDDKNNIYLIKGDSPLSILHLPKKKMYVYASTDSILWKALIDTPLFSAVRAGEFEEITLSGGDILKIRGDGKLERGRFDYEEEYFRGKSLDWWNYVKPAQEYEEDYTDMLKSVAVYEGYYPEIVDELLEQDFTPEEVEEYIYCGDYDLMEV